MIVNASEAYIWVKKNTIFLCADDILLISSNPGLAVPVISSNILLLFAIILISDSFSRIFGYINWSNSLAIPLSKICPPAIRNSWQFKWMPRGLTYLGIKIMQVNIG